MNYVDWKSEYEVGVPDVDRDHRQLVDALNMLHEGIMEGKREEAMRKALNLLLRYSREHFSREESLLRKAEYPELEAHIREHNVFVDKVTGYMERFIHGKTSFSLQLLNFMKDWLLNHIQKTDRKYVPHLEIRNMTGYDSENMD